jgi:hypothetical protein
MDERKELEQKAYLQNLETLVTSRNEQLRAAVIRVSVLEDALKRARAIVDGARSEKATHG